jgi:SAM-dependent methyltransferase
VETDFYEIPSLYDILHTPGTAEEVDGLERIALAWCADSTSNGTPVWLEPACGTGRYLRVAAGRGLRVIGFDGVEAMIRYARGSFARRGLDADLFVADMTDRLDPVEPERVDFAFCLINTIRHLETDDAVLRHLAQVSRALRRGGVYAVGLSTSAYGAEFPSEDTWEGRRGRCAVQQVVQYLPPEGEIEIRRRSERVISHLRVSRPRGEEHIRSTYALRCYSRGQWRRLLGRSALRLLEVVNEVGEQIDPAEAGYGIYVLGRRDR